MKVALITGITGQDGSYLAELLLNKGYEVGFDWNTKKPIIYVDPKYFRPTEVESLLGDSSKAKKELGWEPEISFDELIEDMCIYGQ